MHDAAEPKEVRSTVKIRIRSLIVNSVTSYGHSVKTERVQDLDLKSRYLAFSAEQEDGAACSWSAAKET